MVKISTLFTAVAAATTFGAVTAAPLVQSNANVARQVVNIQGQGETPFGSIPGRIIRFITGLFGKRDVESLTSEEMLILSAMLGGDEPVNVARQLPPELLGLWAAPTIPSPLQLTDLFGKRDLAAEPADVLNRLLSIGVDLNPDPRPTGFELLKWIDSAAEHVNVARQVVNIQGQGETPFGSIPGRIIRFISGLFGKRDLESLTPEEMLMLSAILGQN